MRSDEALLLDMVIALQKISRFTQGLNETMFLTNDLVQSAVIREFQILGLMYGWMSSGQRSSVISRNSQFR